MLSSLAYLAGLTVACWIPLIAVLTAEDRHARLRAPEPIADEVPLLQPHHIGLT